MKNGKRTIVSLVVIAMFIVSCNLPLLNAPDEPGDLAPNLTLTALFDTSGNIPATLTPAIPTQDQQSLPTTLPPTTMPSEALTAESTSFPTNTSVPPTPEVRQRGGTLMKAAYLEDEPVMDGTYAEWVEDTYKYAVPYVVWQKVNWVDMADLEGAFAAAWDEKYLYISVKVTDDVFVQNKTGELMYLGDSVEILIDANLDNDFYSATLSQDDFQFGVSPGNPDKGIEEEVYLWYPTSKKGSKSNVLVSSQFEISPIYRVEIGIPWSMLEITPSTGRHIGFAVSVNDNDKKGENLQQTMISTALYRNFLDPTTWGELVLVKSK